MNHKFGIKSEWESHPIYSFFYKLIKERSDPDKEVEWLEDTDGNIVGISIPLKDGTYQTYRRMFKGYDQISREIWDEMINNSEID